MSTTCAAIGNFRQKMRNARIRRWLARIRCSENYGGDLLGQGQAGSPGAGRAQLRLSRGSRVALACDVNQHKAIVRIDHALRGLGNSDKKCATQGYAIGWLRRKNNSSQNLWGSAFRARRNGKPMVRAEPHLPTPKSRSRSPSATPELLQLLNFFLSPARRSRLPRFDPSWPLFGSA
jgi:hypothetical protein